MAGLDPPIPAVFLKPEERLAWRLSLSDVAAWMAGSSPARTAEENIA
jgi:hypothetical protein